MGIQKQEFYEGAALHLLARTGRINNIQYRPPFFVLNGDLRVLLKYSTKGRSPWGFTFTPDEQRLLKKSASESRTVMGLICGADGIATIDYEALLKIASCRSTAVRIACYRRHGEHYEVIGPDGGLDGKIAPSKWHRVLGN